MTTGGWRAQGIQRKEDHENMLSRPDRENLIQMKISCYTVILWCNAIMVCNVRKSYAHIIILQDNWLLYIPQCNRNCPLSGLYYHCFGTVKTPQSFIEGVSFIEGTCCCCVNMFTVRVSRYWVGSQTSLTRLACEPTCIQRELTAHILEWFL